MIVIRVFTAALLLLFMLAVAHEGDAAWQRSGHYAGLAVGIFLILFCVIGMFVLLVKPGR